MEKTTKKSSVKKTAPVKKVEKETVKETVAVKKTVRAPKSEEPAKETVKKPARKKAVVAPEAVVVASKPEPKKEAVTKPEVKAEAVKPEVKIKPEIKKVEEIKPVPVVERKQSVKPKVAVQRSSTLSLAVGRRKQAVARVWLKLGSGKLLVNEQNYDSYFDTQISRLAVTTPFSVVSKAEHYDVFAKVAGGGKNAQAEAVRLGFVRALLSLNEEWRPVFRKAGLLTVDSRQKERKKYGQRGARRKFQFVKR